jgi:alpha-galactosidase
MTLWSIARSPLIMGGNMPKNDAFTLALMTNDEVIAVNQRSTNNRQVFARNNGAEIAWTADAPGARARYLAIFNALPAPTRGRKGPAPATIAPAGKEPAKIAVSLAEIGLTGPCRVRDLWAHKDLGEVAESLSATVNSHGAVLYRVESR